jgi:chorismate mutase
MNANDLELVSLVTSIDPAVSKIERHKEKFDAARESIILERRRAARAEDAAPSVEPVAR